MSTLLRAYFAIFSVFLLAGFELALWPQYIGSTTAWGVAPGWQREVAFWDFGMLLFLVAVVRHVDRVNVRRVALVLCILNILFGTNHLAAFVSKPEAWGNGMGVFVNYGLLLLGATAVWNDARSTRSLGSPR